MSGGWACWEGERQLNLINVTPRGKLLADRAWKESLLGGGGGGISICSSLKSHSAHLNYHIIRQQAAPDVSRAPFFFSPSGTCQRDLLSGWEITFHSALAQPATAAAAAEAAAEEGQS